MSSPTLSHPHNFHHTSPLLTPPYTSCPLLIPPPLSLHLIPSPYTSSPLLTPPPLSLHLLPSPYTSSPLLTPPPLSLHLLPHLTPPPLSLHLLPSPYTSSPLLTPPPLSLHLLPSPYNSSPLLTHPYTSSPLLKSGSSLQGGVAPDRSQATHGGTHIYCSPSPFLLCTLEITNAVSIPKCIFNVHDFSANKLHLFHYDHIVLIIYH